MRNDPGYDQGSDIYQDKCGWDGDEGIKRCHPDFQVVEDVDEYRMNKIDPQGERGKFLCNGVVDYREADRRDVGIRISHNALCSRGL